VPVDDSLVLAFGEQADADGGYPVFGAAQAGASFVLCLGSTDDCLSGAGQVLSFGDAVSYKGRQVFRAVDTFVPEDGLEAVLMVKDAAGRVTGMRFVEFHAAS
jgi:hypothetical protein